LASNLFTSTVDDLIYTPTDVTSVAPKPYALSLSITKIDSDTRKVTFSLGNTITKDGITFTSPAMKSDVQVLLDKIALCLLTTLGESTFTPTMGASLTRIKTTTGDTLDLQAKLLAAITSVQNMLLNSQRNQNLSPGQTLQQLKLNSIKIDPDDPTGLLVEVIVVNSNNAAYILTV
jgi:hypothetical protein